MQEIFLHCFINFKVGRHDELNRSKDCFKERLDSVPDRRNYHLDCRHDSFNRGLDRIPCIRQERADGCDDGCKYRLDFLPDGDEEIFDCREHSNDGLFDTFP